MSTPPSRTAAFMQMCWVVPDLEAAIDGWVRSAGVGPFFWFDEVVATDGRHRGKPADFPASTAAIAYAGDTQVELVCQENDDPGVFRDLFARGEYGLHHLALICDDYEAERDAYLRRRCRVGLRGADRRRPHLLDRHVAHARVHGRAARAEPVRARGFAAMRAAAEAWDGKDPITRF